MSVPTRINNPSIEELAGVRARLENGEELVVQFDSATYTDVELRSIDALCAKHGNQLEVRFYGHYGTDFDANALLELPRVANLSVNCLQGIRNVEALSALEHLERLSVGIHKLEDPHLLKNSNLKTVRSLSLGPTKSNILDLSCLADYNQLEKLYLSGHTKGISAVSDARSLKSLALWCIPKRTQLDFISGITKLSQLTIGLGGRETIKEIHAPKLQELEIVRVRGLSTLGDLERFPALTILTIEDQIQLKQLDFTLANSRLKYLKLFNCKTLNTISGLEHLSELSAIRVGMTAMDPAQFLDTSFSPALRVCAFYTGKSGENRWIREALDARGYSEFETAS